MSSQIMSETETEDFGEPKGMVHCEDLVKIYKTGDIEVIALRGLDITIAEGEMMAIIGNSGSGKSTLLNMIGGIDKRPLSQGRAAIETEVRSKVPYLKETGGYIPAIDHIIPPDVPLDGFKAYVELIKQIAEREG